MTKTIVVSNKYKTWVVSSCDDFMLAKKVIESDADATSKTCAVSKIIESCKDVDRYMIISLLIERTYDI